MEYEQSILIFPIVVLAGPGRGFSLSYPAVLTLALVAAAGGLVGAGTEAAWGGAWLLPPGEGQVVPIRFFRIPPMRSMHKGISFRFRPIQSSN